MLDGTNCKVFSPVNYYVLRLEPMTSLANPEEKSIQNDAGWWRHQSVILMYNYDINNHPILSKNQ